MILVAFVLVLFATVMLIIGTFFNAGVAYIWISIGACVATFVVLGISYAARRRSADGPGARPAPLAQTESRSAATRTAVSPAATPATTAADETAADADTRVTVVPHRPEGAQDETQVMAPVPGPAEESTVEEPAAAEPAVEEPTTAEAAETETESADEESAPHWPSAAAPATEEVATEEAATEPATDEPTEPAASAEQGTGAPAPRRVAPRRVVRRAEPAAASDADAPAAAAAAAPAATATPRVASQPSDGSTGTGAGRTVVRRAGTGEGQQRVVRRVVRRPDGTVADDQAPPTTGARSGTRGKRARAVLSEIKGVGPAKQDALLKRFGSLEEMASASIEDLAAVKGVGPNVAQQIKQVLSNR